MGLDVNLLDGRFYADDPVPTYRRLRAEAPVYRDTVNGIWGISRYQDVVDVEKDAVRYTSSRGSRPRIVGDVSSINNDDPLHQNKRRLVARRFTPRSVKTQEERVRDVVAAERGGQPVGLPLAVSRRPHLLEADHVRGETRERRRDRRLALGPRAEAPPQVPGQDAEARVDARRRLPRGTHAAARYPAARDADPRGEGRWAST